METIEDIVREMRKDIPRVVDVKVILRNYADRIEAAVKYTLAVEKAKAAGEGYTAGKQSVTDCNQLGNSAKMRKALEVAHQTFKLVYENAVEFIQPRLSDEIIHTGLEIEVALSSPARNCDLYATPKEAGEAFISESCENPCGNCTVSDDCHNPLIHECGINWLFAEAKGK